jgi:hypothetical protein
MTPQQRRQWGTGSVHPAHKPGCPHHARKDVAKCWENGCRMRGSIDAGYTRSGGRRRPVVTGRTEAEVKRKLRDKVRALEAGSARSSAPATVKSWSDVWLPLVKARRRPSSYIASRTAVRNWIVPTIGHMRLADLTPVDIRAVDTAVTAVNSTTTALRYRSTLMKMLKDAVREGHTVPDRVFHVDPPVVAVTDREAMPTEDAIKMLAAATTLPHGSTWAAAFLQGLRPAERRGLTWDAVGEDTFTVSWQLQSLPYNVRRDRSSGFRIPDGFEHRQVSGALHLVRPKTKAGCACTRWCRGCVTPSTTGVAIADPPTRRAGWCGRWPPTTKPTSPNGSGCKTPERPAPVGPVLPPPRSRHTTATPAARARRSRVGAGGDHGPQHHRLHRAYEHVDDPQVRQALMGMAGRLQLTPPTRPRTS